MSDGPKCGCMQSWMLCTAPLAACSLGYNSLFREFRRLFEDLVSSHRWRAHITEYY